MRVSQRDHLWSFQHYANDCRCYYVNIGFHGLPTFLQKIKFDLVVYTWSFLGTRGSRKWFAKTLKSIKSAKNITGMRVAMPQDEFLSMDLLCNFIDEFKIDVVFTVAPQGEWQKIYRTVDFKKVKFIRILTGYLDDKTVKKYKHLSVNSQNRKIDIGYRVVSQAIWGRFNLLKGRIAEIFNEVAAHHNLKSDIAVGVEYFKYGDEWLEFLSSCRFTIGVEGGSSLLDWDGSLSKKIYKYLRENPDASYDSLERECFPNDKDGEISIKALSPRHLEACLTKTGQVLVEGEYNGVLLPNIHYIPLSPDFSNLEDVIEKLKNEPLRRKLVEQAYLDIVLSGKYTYSEMVKIVLNELPAKEIDSDTLTTRLLEAFLYHCNKCILMIDTLYVPIYSKLILVKNKIKKSIF